MMSGPGPAKYALPQHTGTANLDVRKTFAPAYSMRPLHKDLSSSERSPGPKYMIKPGLFRDGSYYGKQYTMRPLYKEIKSMATPGPGKYGAADPTKTIERNAPSYTMRPQLRFGKTDKIPGANSYKLPTMTGTRVNMSAPGRLASEPSWSLTGRSDYGSFTGVSRANTAGATVAPRALRFVATPRIAARSCLCVLVRAVQADRPGGCGA